MRKALVVGIDNYENSPLVGCEKDANRIADLLETNGDGSPNFEVMRLISDTEDVTTEILMGALEKLFQGEAETAIFYFAGHGIINEATNNGFIVTSNGSKPNWGIPLADIVTLASKNTKIRTSVIMLDSCHSGYAGEISMLGDDTLSTLPNGMTIMTGCQRDGLAADGYDGGTFTNLVVEGLRGAAADVLGRISPAAIYTLVDQTLGAFEQRPIYKANVQSFVSLRQIEPKVSISMLRKLHEFFPAPSDVFALDKTYENDRSGMPDGENWPEPIEENVKIYKFFQSCNRQGLIKPNDVEDMYYAAINETGCKLTALGAHYRKMAETRKF